MATRIFEILLLLIPFGAALWAAFRKVAIRRFTDASIILLVTLIVAADGFAATMQLQDSATPAWIDKLQLFFGVLILPLAYAYFAHQVGSGWKNRAIYECLAVSLIVLLPNIVLFTGDATLSAGTAIQAKTFQIIKNGTAVFITDLSDIVILLQAVIILFRVITFSRSLKKLELAFSKELNIFFLLALGCVLYTIATYIIPWSFWQSHRLLFIGGFSLFISAEFIQLAANRDISALVTKESREPVVLDEYIKMNNDLATRARILLEKEKRYLLPGIVIDDMVGELGTNRTYFTRMMRIEFGQSFSEYINNQRVKYSQDLLINTDKSIADIAEESGFTSASAYNRVFKRLTDTTPESWREQHAK